jgi:hypothetical protein
VFLTRPPRSSSKEGPVRLACIRHAASVYPEPGSNSPSQSPHHRALCSEIVSGSAHSGSVPKQTTLTRIRITSQLVRCDQIQGEEKPAVLAGHTCSVVTEFLQHERLIARMLLSVSAALRRFGGASRPRFLKLWKYTQHCFQCQGRERYSLTAFSNFPKLWRSTAIPLERVGASLPAVVSPLVPGACLEPRSRAD